MLLLGWYLIYTEQIIRVFRADAASMTRMFAAVQTGITSPDTIEPLEALVTLQRMIIESGVPLILVGPGDTVLNVVNAPFQVDVETPEGQERVRAYMRRLAVRNPPIGDPESQRIYYGDPPELQRLRWVPWLQVGGLVLTLVLGILVVRAQRRAEADRAWTSMARELAHQLGTPISSLKGWLEVLRLSPGNRPGLMDDPAIAGEIGEDVDRLERVSRRFELIGHAAELEPLGLDEITAAVERYLGARIPRLSAGVGIEVEVPAELPKVRGNEVLLTWALENVVKNALDALAGRGGHIRIHAFAGEEGWVVLEVEDTGPGVDPAVRDRLFEAGTTTKSGGWGVGLSLSRRIVERLHGGRIDLVRTGPEGTAFQIRLPTADTLISG